MLNYLLAETMISDLHRQRAARRRGRR